MAGVLFRAMTQYPRPEDPPALHERLFTIDTHFDTPTASLPKAGWDFGARHDYADDGSQCDLPRMAQGGLDAAVFAAYFTQGARSPAGHAAATAAVRKILERTHAVVAANSAACGLALTAGAALQLKTEGKRAIFFSIENAYSLGTDAGAVREFYDLGVRMIGLTHMLNNELADASTDPRGTEWAGLSPLGRAVLAECNRLGIAVDASHASDAALAQLLKLSTAPVILSHSGCRAVCDHPRNIGDDLLSALAARGGVIQINALPVALTLQPDHGARTAAVDAILARFRDEVVTPEVRAAAGAAWTEFERTFPPAQATLEDFVAHVVHAVAVAGIDHVGIGCDLDGGGGGFAGLRDVADYPGITRELVKRGFCEEDLAKIWGGNTLRLLRAAQGAAGA